MALTGRDVERVANLARLHVTEEEKEALAGELSRILEYAGQLQRLELAGVEATSHIGVEETVVRPDEPRPSLPLDAVLANAPASEDGQFRVPAVLEG